MPYVIRIPLTGLMVLLLAVACSPGESEMELASQNRQLQGELDRERFLRWRLQVYIDSTLGGGSAAFLEKMASFEPIVRTDTIWDTLRVVQPPVQQAERVVSDPAAERLERELKSSLGSWDQRMRLRREGNEVILNLEEKMLFDSEAARLTADGKAVLKKLGNVFLKTPEMLITVEGHLDASPQQSEADSWERSLTRALSVGRALMDAGIPPSQIRVAGRGFFAPVADNQTEAGRYLNRRTEIILKP